MTIETFDKFVEFNKENTEALVKSGNAAFKGLEEISKASQVLASKAVDQADTVVKAVLACKTPADFADLQGRLARESVETAIAESRKMIELMSATFTAAVEPLNARITAIQPTFGKFAA